jgi:glyoxylase-like metal-dependent hydrolase (beta-lactamase superfamily II)
VAPAIHFSEITDGVLVARTSPLDVNVTLILGDDGALVVDTLSTDEQARALHAAIRAITPLPLTVLNTHFHFDHCFGNSVFAADGARIWAHENAAAELTERGGHWQRRWYADWAAQEPELASGLAAATVCAPTDVVRTSEVLDLGGRRVTMAHFGHGHTAGDVVALVPEANVVVTGDLVEESGPPDFSDAHPLEWPATLAVLLQLSPPEALFVPGHGAVVDGAFVQAQHAALADMEWLIRDGHRDGATVAALTARGPFPPDTNRVAVERGYYALDDPTR